MGAGKSDETRADLYSSMPRKGRSAASEQMNFIICNESAGDLETLLDQLPITPFCTTCQPYDSIMIVVIVTVKMPSTSRTADRSHHMTFSGATVVPRTFSSNHEPRFV